MKKSIFACFAGILMVMFLSSCTFAPLSLKAPVKDVRLYEQHNQFVKVVKYNLGIPDKSTITYKIENPFINNNGKEVVNASFFEDGLLVARAICYTNNGDVSQLIQSYSPNNNSKQTPNPNNNVNNNTVLKSTVNYNKYTNVRFGYTIEYPDFLIAQPEAQNGDGRKFVSSDGKVELSVWGSWLGVMIQQPLTLDVLNEYILDNLDYAPTYKAKRENFVVFSGYKGNNIVYEKHILKSDGCVCSFVIKYPADKKEEYDDIITHIAYNMSVGSGIDSTVVK